MNTLTDTMPTLAGTAATAPGPLLLDAAQLARDFDQRPFLIRHRLVDHPLLQLPRLVELAQTLPESSVEYNAGELALGQDAALTPRTGLSIEETLRRIESCRSWMVLKNVEQQAPYKQLLDECLDQMQATTEGISPGMFHRQAFIFVSSPSAVTPYHADFEYNFLLQVRGTKSMAVFDDQDRELLAEPDRERVVNGGSRNLPYQEQFLSRGQVFELSPGIGLHVPLSAPHWVRVGPQFSISFSITFQSKVSARRLAVHKANQWLRARGFQPRDVGASRAADAVKLHAWRVSAKLQSLANSVLRRAPST